MYSLSKTQTIGRQEITPNLTLWLYGLLCFHLVAWTLIPSWVRAVLPIDAMEGTTWGRQLEWGYDKNPFLNAWVTELGVKLAGQTDWIIYCFSQIAIVISLWAVWQLAKKIVTPVYAFISVLLLEGVQYFNFAGIDLNDNLLELPIWALLSLCFYQAITRQKTMDWVGVGIFAGLAMMDKYYAVMLLLPTLLFLLTDSERGKNFSKPGIYVALSVFVIMITPHIIWLWQHNFITVTYAFNRVSAAPESIGNIPQPLNFLLLQVLTFVPSLLLFSTLWWGKRGDWLVSERRALTRFNRDFLIMIGFGPFVLTVLLSVLTGITLQTMWGTPLLSLWGIGLIAWLQPHVTSKQLRRFVIAVTTFMVLIMSLFIFIFIHTGNLSKAQYPGRAIAAALTTQWRNKYHTPLPYVAGQRWLTGNISFYSPDRPAVYIEWSPKASPWIDERQIKEKGAVFVWDTRDLQKLPYAIRYRFPGTQTLPNQAFQWVRDSKAPPLVIGVAFLPPKSDWFLKK